MTKGNFKKWLRCEEFPDHFQQFPMTVSYYVTCSSRMAAHRLFSCTQRTKPFLVFSILGHQNYLVLKLYFIKTTNYSFPEKLRFQNTLEKSDTDIRKFCHRIINENKKKKFSPILPCGCARLCACAPTNNNTMILPKKDRDNIFSYM